MVRPADDCFTGADCPYQVIPAGVIDTHTSGRERNIGNGEAIRPVGNDAGVERFLNEPLLFEEFLQGCRIVQQGWGDSAGDLFQPLYPVAQLVIDLFGDERDG